MLLKKLMIIIYLGVFLCLAPTMAAVNSDLPDFTQIAADEGSAVVNIRTTYIKRAVDQSIPDEFSNDPFFDFFRRFIPPQLREYQVGSLGSGFIISSDGYVLTNAHVVAQAENIIVTLIDKREFKAKLVGSDKRTDIALLKIQGNDLPTVKLGSSAALKVGEWVLAIGSPFGLSNSVSAGIVSAIGRQLPNETFVPFIQTDAAINRGNSGGPLFNLDGEVIGVNSQILSGSGQSIGISFAIPIDLAMSITEQLKTNGKVSRGRIGLTTQPINKELAEAFGLPEVSGALINTVEPGSPAKKSGLQRGDIILAVNHQTIVAPEDLRRVIATSKAGTIFKLTVWRKGAEQSVDVVSEELADPTDQTSQPKVKAAEGSRIGKLGLTVMELSPAQKSRLGVKYGLIVRAMSVASERSDIQVGDVIVGIGTEPLLNVQQLRDALSKSKQSVALQILRNGATLFVALPVADDK